MANETRGESAEKKGITAVDRIVADRIRTLRYELGLTQQQLAGPLGISYQQLQKYENATDRVSAARLFAIARALGRPVSDFFPDEEAAVQTPTEHRAQQVRRAAIARALRDDEGGNSPALVHAICALVALWPKGAADDVATQPAATLAQDTPPRRRRGRPPRTVVTSALDAAD